ncbi:uncharacterized protein LOC134965851 [Pseudophryne corroboree]|uniref:uncharacterized protein LOC134965851 n=1 Tax=Pseudophryne corroboree TaxID=495146 RepID=UPI0030814DE9
MSQSEVSVVEEVSEREEVSEVEEVSEREEVSEVEEVSEREEVSEEEGEVAAAYSSDSDSDGVVAPQPRTTTKTGRNVKFSYSENMALVRELMRHHRQLFGSDAAKVSTRRKTVLWGKVVAAVNSEGVVRRTEDTCRKRFYDIKRRVKAKMAKEAKSARQTWGGHPFRASYKDWEEPMRSLIPTEVVSTLHVRDSDRPRSDVRQRSSTSRPQPTLPRADDGGNAGSSSVPRPLRRPSQGSVTVATRPSKRPRVQASAPATAPASPPRRRISAVAAVPPLALLASPQSDEPQSPQLSDPAIMSDDGQQDRAQETFTLHLQPIDPTQANMAQDIPQQPQASQTQQMSSTPGTMQTDQEFWSGWASHQAHHSACLTTQIQHLSSLPHHLPKVSRNSARLIVQVGRIANTMEQMRADNSQMQANHQRIMDEQQRQHQTLIQIIQHNQVINDNLSRIIANNTAAYTQLTASLNILSQNLSVMGQHHVTSSSGTTTPSQTPVQSPVRRSSRSRTHEPPQASAPSTQKK